MRVLSDCPALILTEVYAAGEAHIAGADGRALSRAVRQRGRVDPIFIEQLDELPALLRANLRDGDLVLCLGAGTIGQAAIDLVTDNSAGGVQ